MSFSSIFRDVRDGFGSLSRRGFEVRLLGHRKGKSHGAVHELHDPVPMVQNSPWANLPPELLLDVIERLEVSEDTWPSRKHVVACAAVCRTWRDMCKEIVGKPEFSGKITFPASLKQPGPRDGLIQCFIKRFKSTQTYYLYLSLSSAVLDEEDGKFLLSAKRNFGTTCTEYVISMDADNISSLTNTYIGKLRSNFLGTKFVIYDTQPPYGANITKFWKTNQRFGSKKNSTKVCCSRYSIAQISYELNVLGTRGPRRMNCIMHSIPASCLEAGGSVPCQPDSIFARSLNESFSSASFGKSAITEHSMHFGSARFSDVSTVGGPGTGGQASYDDEECRDRPLVLHNKAPRWHEQLRCWCLNFRGRVTVASVKNFQLVAAAQPAAGAPTPLEPAAPTPLEQEKVILQFGKVSKDMFTMDYCYPLSAFQAFAICLSSFDTKLACE